VVAGLVLDDFAHTQGVVVAAWSRLGRALVAPWSRLGRALVAPWSRLVDSDGWVVSSERVRVVRDDQQRAGMSFGLVRSELLRALTRQRPSAQPGPSTGEAGRFVPVSRELLFALQGRSAQQKRSRRRRRQHWFERGDHDGRVSPFGPSVTLRWQCPVMAPWESMTPCAVLADVDRPLLR
jgi:hypothetical protein